MEGAGYQVHDKCQPPRCRRHTSNVLDARESQGNRSCLRTALEEKPALLFVRHELRRCKRCVVLGEADRDGEVEAARWSLPDTGSFPGLGKLPLPVLVADREGLWGSRRFRRLV